MTTQWATLTVAALTIISAVWRSVVLVRRQIRESFEEAQTGVVQSLTSLEARMQQVASDQASVSALVSVFFQASPQAMYWSDEHGITVRCNQAYLEFFGFETMAQARSNDWLNLVVDRRLAESRLESIICQPQDFDFPHIRLRDGRRMRVVGHKVELQGKFRGYVGYVFNEDGSDLARQVEDLRRELLAHANREESTLSKVESRLGDHLDWEERGRPSKGNV